MVCLAFEIKRKSSTLDLNRTLKAPC